MKSFNWLHLTDLHFGQPGQQSLWPNVREVFWRDLETLHAKSGPWDAVLFTGDLVYSGSAAEFDELENKFLGPLWEHFNTLGQKAPVMLAVPGNHDLVRPDYKKPKAALRFMLQRKGFSEIAEEFWTDPNCEYRQIIASSFANYESWARKNARLAGVELTAGILPGDFAATLSVETGEAPPLKIGISGVNTTFLQLANGDFTRRLAFNANQVSKACGGDLPAWVKAHDTCILMTHQGPEWFDEISFNQDYSEVNPSGRFGVHLFGHMHENTLRSTATGGGSIVRQWQGNSLFGLEKFGDPPRLDRRHGYAAGRIEFETDRASIRHWPRRAIKDQNGWRFTPDHDSCVLLESESCTNPEHLEIVAGKRDKELVAKNSMLTIENSSVSNQAHYGRHLQEMEMQLQQALEAFKGQPKTFVEPKLSRKREFNEDPNELHRLIETPFNALIIAPAEFGLTCLGLYLQLEAFRKGRFWLYVDAELTKGRKIDSHIHKELLHYNKSIEQLQCVIVDNWNAENFEHLAIVKNISTNYPELILIILAEDSIITDVAGNLSKAVRNFEILHLQALSKKSMRKLVAEYNNTNSIGTEDVVLSCLAAHLESINIHRTPLNCYTLLRVLDSSYTEKLVNKCKLLKAILFVLFTDHDSFSFLSEKPEVDECSFVLGCFCKDLLKNGTRHFDSATLVADLRKICDAHSIVLNVTEMVNVLRANNILVDYGNQTAFRHRHWILYFAAEWMRHDEEFRLFVLAEMNYVNYAEVMEFYAGTDGKRADALETILSDLNSLITEVDNKIGIERSFDPLSQLLWDPTDEYLEQARLQIAERVESSNLPSEIKDEHADRSYQSVAPYDQSVSKFLKNFSVLSLLQIIKAASCALRISPFVDIKLRNELTSAIFRGWEEISRVAFWLSPILAKEGRAIHDGFSIMLADGFSSDVEQRFNEIIVANPINVARILGPDLASKKITLLLKAAFSQTASFLQKHMIALLMVSARPIGWEDSLRDYINHLHPRSFYLGDIMSRLASEIRLGDLEHGEERALKRLTRAILSKREYAPRVSEAKALPRNKILSEENMLPIDKLLKGNRKSRFPS
jgi:hypothetical protein